MTAQGYIKLHRQIENNWLWTSEKFTKAQAWIDLLLLANHKNSSFFVRGIKIELKRGQLARAEDKLAQRWQWSKGKVRRFIKLLIAEQQIEQHTSNEINVLTIINYNFYQKTEQQMKQQNKPEEDNKTPEAQNNKIEYMPELLNQEFWRSFVKKLKQNFNKIDKDIFERWLSKVEPFYQDDQEIILSVSSKFLRDWIKREYLKEIKKIYQKINNNPDSKVTIIYSASKEQNSLIPNQ